MITAILILATAFPLVGPDATATPQAISPTKPLALFNGNNLDGFYTWLKDTQYKDPRKVFSITNSMIRMDSGIGLNASAKAIASKSSSTEPRSTRPTTFILLQATSSCKAKVRKYSFANWNCDHCQRGR